jgi:hypothetical protein
VPRKKEENMLSAADASMGELQVSMPGHIRTSKNKVKQRGYGWLNPGNKTLESQSETPQQKKQR